MTILRIGTRGSAVFSDNWKYRYLLTRDWAEKPPAKERVCWILLNPSTASEDKDDPTIKRCIGFSAEWGFEGCDIVNLFAFRSTNPKALYKMTLEAAQGPENKRYVLAAIANAGIVVCAWGVHGGLYEQGLEVRVWAKRAGGPASHLGLTKGGQPKHPLYLHGGTILQRWV